MLDVDLVAASEVERAAAIFHRDGFVCIEDGLNAEQLSAAQAGAERIVVEQTEAVPFDEANRGFARYSFGQQIHHPEWAMLIDLPTVLPVVEAIFGYADFTCSGAGGDYSMPGARIQKLHSDLGEFLRDPSGRSSCCDLPTPFIVVNFLMCDFTVENGAIRFIPCTHRSQEKIPSLDEEPVWMKTNTVCAPAGTGVVRDVRCWHGGTANNSDRSRVMTRRPW